MAGLGTGDVVVRREKNGEQITIKKPPSRRDRANGIDRNGYQYVEDNWFENAVVLKMYDLEMVFELAQEESTLLITDPTMLSPNNQKMKVRQRRYEAGTRKEQRYNERS